MATSEMGMADYFLKGFDAALPDGHPAHSALAQARRFGKEKHEGLVAYELADLTIGWLQELVAKEGGEQALLDDLPGPTDGLHARSRQIALARAAGPLSDQAGAHALSAQEHLSKGNLSQEAESAGACFSVLLTGRDSPADALADQAVAQAQSLHELGSRKDPEDTASWFDEP